MRKADYQTLALALRARILGPDKAKADACKELALFLSKSISVDAEKFLDVCGVKK